MGTGTDFRVDAAERLIVALDLPSGAEALRLVDRTEARVRWYKIGLELFYAAGPALVQELRHRGHRIFLDLKLHDIPNTVSSAVRSLSHLDVQLLTVHAAGGSAMVGGAVEAAKGAVGGPEVLAVTVLTSVGEAELVQMGVGGGTAAQVERLADLARAAGAHGLVCSAQEVGRLRQRLGAGVRLVTPGIRPAGASADDQSRTSSPREAILAGASQLVVGRPITQAADPLAAVDRVLEEIEAAVAQAEG